MSIDNEASYFVLCVTEHVYLCHVICKKKKLFHIYSSYNETILKMFLHFPFNPPLSNFHVFLQNASGGYEKSVPTSTREMTLLVEFTVISSMVANWDFKTYKTRRILRALPLVWRNINIVLV
jgi:hypothetical protein